MAKKEELSDDLERKERKWIRSVIRASSERRERLKGKGIKYAVGVCSTVVGRPVEPEEVKRLCPGVYNKAKKWEEESIATTEEWADKMRQAAKRHKWLEGYKRWVRSGTREEEFEEEEEEEEMPRLRRLKRLRRK